VRLIVTEPLRTYWGVKELKTTKNFAHSDFNHLHDKQQQPPARDNG